MGINLIIEKESLYLLAVDTSRPKPPVRMPRVPASHISGGAPALPLQHYIEILTTLNHSKKEKNHCMFESAASHRAQPLVRSSRFHRRLLARKISKNQKKKFFEISPPNPQKKKKKKKK